MNALHGVPAVPLAPDDLCSQVIRVCAWCNALLGQPPGTPTATLRRNRRSAHVTHGVCPTCAGESGMVPVEDLSAIFEYDDEALPFGTLELDPGGVILAYQPTDPEPARRNWAGAVGRDFFAEVARCARVARIAELYREMVGRGRSDRATVSCVLRFARGAVFVHIVLAYDAALGHGLVLVQKLS